MKSRILVVVDLASPDLAYPDIKSTWSSSFPLEVALLYDPRPVESLNSAFLLSIPPAQLERVPESTLSRNRLKVGPILVVMQVGQKHPKFIISCKG